MGMPQAKNEWQGKDNKIWVWIYPKQNQANRTENMKLGKYIKANEGMKQLVSKYQQSKEFNLQEFKKLNEDIFNSSVEKQKDLALFEDCLIKLLEFSKKIEEGATEWLVGKQEDNYHYWLWKLHQRIIQKEKALKTRELPKYLRIFNKILKSPKYFFRGEKEGEFFIATKIGCALGHQSTIHILPNSISVEYADHSPSRTLTLLERMKKKGFICSEMKVLKDIFEKRDEGKNNYFFSAEKFYLSEKQEDLEKTILWLALDLYLGIDVDWLILNTKSAYTQEEIDNEKKILELAFLMHDIFGLKPKHLCDMLLTLLRVSCQ
jgi:hypothetical protein